MRRFVAVAILAALAACTETSAPHAPQVSFDQVNWLLRDANGTTVLLSGPRTEPQPVIYTTHHVHPDGVSDPVSDRAAAVIFGIGTLGVAADPDGPRR